MMWSILIFVLSLATLLMFFVSYCRSLMASSTAHPFSSEVRDVTGIFGLPSGSDFVRVTQLLRLCPERPEDRPGLQAVEIYYHIVHLLQRLLPSIAPAIRGWVDRELAGCTAFAVVVLDRRIAFSRELLAQQADI